MNLHTILIADDNSLNRDTLYDLLFSHYRIVLANDGQEAFEAAINHNPSLAILDMNMPKLDGIETCKKIRSTPNIRSMPIIMMSGDGDESSRTKAFLSGVDDFVQSPVTGQELVARIISKLNWQRQLVTIQDNSALTLGNLTLNERTLSISINDFPLKLTHFEYTLLKYFIENKEKLISKKQILEEIWKSHCDATRTVDTHVYSLRKKLKDFCYEFTTIHGSGYILTKKNQ